MSEFLSFAHFLFSFFRGFAPLWYWGRLESSYIRKPLPSLFWYELVAPAAVCPVVKQRILLDLPYGTTGTSTYPVFYPGILLKRPTGNAPVMKSIPNSYLSYCFLLEWDSIKPAIVAKTLVLSDLKVVHACDLVSLTDESKIRFSSRGSAFIAASLLAAVLRVWPFSR